MANANPLPNVAQNAAPQTEEDELATRLRTLRLPIGYRNPPALPGAYRSSDKVLTAKVLAYSVLTNRRNLESPLHGLYSQVFTELTQPYSNLTPCINYTMYLNVKDDDVVPVPGLGHNVPEDIEPVSDNEDAGSVHERIQDLEDQNLSFISSNSVHGQVPEKCPDLVVVHSRWIRMPEVTSNMPRREIVHYVHRHGVKPKHYCLALIGEFKSGIDRSLDRSVDTLESHEDLLLRNFGKAYDQLAKYCAMFFISHPHIDRVLAVSASGIYWRHAYITKEDLPEYDPFEDVFEEAFIEPESSESGESDDNTESLGFDISNLFSNIFEVGTSESDRELSTLRDDYLHPLGCDGYLGTRS